MRCHSERWGNSGFVAHARKREFQPSALLRKFEIPRRDALSE